MERIPENRILTQNNYGDSYKDTVESFNLDLTGNYGAIRTTRMKLSDDETSLKLEKLTNVAAGFAYYNSKYWAIGAGYVFEGGSALSDDFDWESNSNAPQDELSSAYSDIELFNGSMYVSADTSVFKLSTTTWSEPVTTQLTASRPHLLKAFGTGDNSRLYITDEYYKVHSISTADAISATGSFTMDLKLGNEWVISMLEAGQNSLWIGLVNIENGKGLVFEWDGVTENIYDRRIELEAGVIAGVVFENIPMIVDARGRIMEYNGSGFVEKDRFFLKDQFHLYNTYSARNDRFIHVNGICTTDYGTILIAMQNEQDDSYGNEDTVPSGVYEYLPGVGLTHRYSISDSPKADTTITDYGQQRLARMGAIFFSRARAAADDRNGTLLVGAEVYSDYTDILTNTPKSGIYFNDTIDTTPKMGYFITRKFYSNSIQEAWDKVYAIYRKFQSETDKIVVKYRLTEKNSMSASCTWLSDLTFNTTDDVSDFAVGDEVTILTGTGAGQSLKITDIQVSALTYSVTVESNPFSATGSFAARFENFQYAGTIDNDQQFDAKTFPTTTSPWIQLKIEMYFTGRQELHKLQLNSKTNI